MHDCCYCGCACYCSGDIDDAAMDDLDLYMNCEGCGNPECCEDYEAESEGN